MGRRNRPALGRGARPWLRSQRTDTGGAGQRSSPEPERDLDCDQQRPDALEGVCRRTEGKDSDSLSGTVDAPAKEKDISDPRQPARAPLEAGSPMASGKRRQDRSLLSAQLLAGVEP